MFSSLLNQAYRGIKLIEDKFIRGIINYPRTCLSLAAIISALFVPFIPQLESDFSAKIWFDKSDPNIKTLEYFEQTFGSDEAIVVILHHDNTVFSPRGGELLRRVTEKMWQVSDVLRVESLSNFYWSYAQGDDLITESFLPEDIDERLLDWEAIKKRSLRHRMIKGLYSSESGRSFAIYARLAHRPNASYDYEKIYHGTEDALAPLKKEFPSFAFHIMGQPSLNHHFQISTFDDIYTITPILLLLVIIYLAYMFRSPRGVVIPLMIVGASLCSTIGMASLFGFKFNSLTFILPSILIAISIADSVHMLTTYNLRYAEFGGRRKAAYLALKKNLWPVFLTSISTSIGFFSLTTSEIQPVHDLGSLAGWGTLFAMVFSYLIVIPMILIGSSPTNVKQASQVQMISKQKIKVYVEWLKKNNGKVIVLFSLVSVGAFVLGIMNEINSNPYKYFKKSHMINTSNQLILEEFRGVGGPEIIIDSGREDGIKDPIFLKKVESFQQWLEAKPEVNRAVSVINILKEMNQALMGGKEEEFRLNHKQDVISQELFLYTMALPQGMDLNNRIDLKNRKLRLSLLWSIQNSKESLQEIENIMTEASKRGLSVEVTGKAILFQKMNSYIVYTFFYSMTLALGLIALMLLTVFKSFKLGLMSLIPNFFPIMFASGLLTLLEKPIDLGCAIVASVTLGIAVDDTIHFLSHYNIMRKHGHAVDESLVSILSTTGMALIVTTAILVSCFGLFMLASLIPNINFGILCAFVLTLALVCDLVILPALILFVEKKSE